MQERGPDSIRPVVAPVVAALTSDLVYARNNPPNLESPTMTRLYQEYLRRLNEVVANVPASQKAERFLLLSSEVTRLGQWIYPGRPQASRDQMLDFLVDRGFYAKLARVIVEASLKQRAHRPPDPEARRESIRAYDLSVNGKTVEEIARFLFPAECEPGLVYPPRNPIERTRLRVREVKKLLDDFGLSSQTAK